MRNYYMPARMGRTWENVQCYYARPYLTTAGKAVIAACFLGLLLLVMIAQK